MALFSRSLLAVTMMMLVQAPPAFSIEEEDCIPQNSGGASGGNSGGTGSGSGGSSSGGAGAGAGNSGGGAVKNTGGAMTTCANGGSGRDAFLHPFNGGTLPPSDPNGQSAWNRPMGSGANYATNGSLQRNVGWNFNTDNGWSFKVVEANASDPMVNVTWDGQWGGHGVPATVRVPNGLNNGGTSDAQIIVYDSTTGDTAEYYNWHWNNGHPTASLRRTDSDYKDAGLASGKGHGGDGQTLSLGTRAAGTSGMGGLLRGWEVNTPGTEINHALAIELTSSQLGQTKRWPATNMDSSVGGNSGGVAYGALVGIPPVSQGGPDLTKLGLSEAGLRVAQAMVNYGGYVVDRSENMNIEGDQDVNPGVRDQIINDLKKLQPYLKEVTNNSASQTVSGGGTAMASHAAAICGQ